jgi:hypothetical protein
MLLRRHCLFLPDKNMIVFVTMQFMQKSHVMHLFFLHCFFESFILIQFSLFLSKSFILFVLFKNCSKGDNSNKIICIQKWLHLLFCVLIYLHTQFKQSSLPTPVSEMIQTKTCLCNIQYCTDMFVQVAS